MADAQPSLPATRPSPTLRRVISGTVLSLHRWPVKSFRGEPRDTLDLDARGVPGDRAHAVWLKGGKRATARVVPGLLRWAARYEQPLNGAIPVPEVTSPDGTPYSWDDPALPSALSADLGRDVDVVRDPAGMQDLPNSILLTLEPTRTALERELGIPVDLRRFRTNVHVDLGVDRGWAEAGWEGRRIRIGDAELELLHPCLRCSMVARDPDTNAKSPAVLKHLIREHGAIFGINARPLDEATIRSGDPVILDT
jgi:uncharacterized protein YcbX